jgi:hypothetical protein
MVFVQFSTSTFLICLTILRMPIPIVFFLGLWTWGSHSHFIGIGYTTRGPIGRNVICYGSPSCYSPYNNSAPYLCFLFTNKWHTYNRFYIKCDSCFCTTRTKVFNIKAFSATKKMCSLVSIGVRQLYIISSWFFYSRFRFSYFGHTSGIQIIHWIIYAWSSSWGSWDKI